MRPYTDPDSAFDNQAYRYVNKLNGSPEFWIYKTKHTADGTQLTISKYNKDSVTGFLSTWNLIEKGVQYVQMSSFLRNSKGQVGKLTTQFKNDPSYDCEQQINSANPFVTIKATTNLGELNPLQSDLMAASTLNLYLVGRIDSFTLPNNKTYHDCIEILVNSRNKIISKSGRQPDKDVVTDDIRTIYAKGVGPIYIGYNEANTFIEEKAYYLDTAIDGSSFAPFDH